jgi:selenide,water dikinase
MASATPLTVRLTHYSHGAGCACKLGPAELAQVLRHVPGAVDPRVLVDAATGDDAAVFQIAPDRALVATVDFFTPIVDDAYDFGRIAAANAFSDVYAMGGAPLLALNLVGWPRERLPFDLLGEVLRGGQDIAREAGAGVLGGHSIDDPEPKYGMAVVGVVAPGDVLTNAGGRQGDALVLTKPLGAGAVATAIKRGLATDEVVERAVTVMTTLNDRAAEHARAAGAHALTDVSGFGLLGHLHELASASGLAAEVDAAAVPAIALELLEDDRCVAGGSRRNRADAEGFTRWGDVPEVRRRLLTDAMTSGGLLAAVPAERAGGMDGALIGRLVPGEPGTIAVS